MTSAVMAHFLLSLTAALSFDLVTVTLCFTFASIYVTLHYEMSRNVPDGSFHVLNFLKVNSMLFTMVTTMFKSED